MRKVSILILIAILFTISWADNLFLNVINISADSTGNVLIVDKSHQKMFVVRSNAPGAQEILKQYRITTGRRNGDKEREGDLKTPEGIYYINGRIPDSQLTVKYGPLAFSLDYPNYVDRLQKRNGSNIWIHGRDEEISDFITEGCISLDNNHILDLRKYIVIRQTPVIILDNLDKYNVEPENFKAAMNHWTEYINNWAKNWDSGAIAEYCDYYAPNFIDENGRNWQQFKSYKMDLEKRYQWKTVLIDEISVLVSEPEAHLKFRQRYLSPTFYSEGQKQLILMPIDSKWKVVRETFRPTIPSLTTEEMVTQFLTSWEKAWERKDIEAYIDFYAKEFTSGEYDLASWKNYKAQVFQSVKNISVKWSALKIQTVQEQVWKVTFRQVYQSDDYRDVGLKTLTIKGLPGNLKIIGEDWVAEK
ncbi:MAG TPA: L,D-transpeptidase family protein [Candidatus Marinimicrobia bacterium]|nr:L,D-transpeptidase family protein [Candidatus Neomarinimicrobiota bacterium]HRS51778.1 L,D-transpeptidase family protein [Candidatus Neomarinimicrobiota bacterium]HRU93048.1 L,D-transpeptidase family protein [Candidatus Neomarinimicrobiota bacterium]